MVHSKYNEILDWLLEGDISIQYQVYRDLLGTEKKELQDDIACQGWGAYIMSKRKPSGHWGLRFYQPKWISTHYTLLDLRNLNLSPENKLVRETITMVLDTLKSDDGGIQLGPSTSVHGDVCVNGMFLNYASYFRSDEKKLASLIDSILNEIMEDGGFNCRTTRSGAKHSSLHTTISVLEGFTEYVNSAYSYRIDDVKKAIESSLEFILCHHLFKSDKTGKIIHKDFLKLSYPGRWRYDILRSLDYFRHAGRKLDSRMNSALEVLMDKRRKDGLWNVQAHYPGEVHILMEKAGKPSRWNTLRALRVLNHFEE